MRFLKAPDKIFRQTIGFIFFIDGSAAARQAERQQRPTDRAADLPLVGNAAAEGRS